MKVLGIDFTSVPSNSKRITCFHGALEGNELVQQDLWGWPSFDEFENALAQPGPWIAGIDFPFGQSRRFVEKAGWPMEWSAYVAQARKLERTGFCDFLNEYKEHRPAGDKEHRRATDKLARSISPQKLRGVPVGLMFFEGAPRLLKSDVTIPFLKRGDPSKIVVEAYPSVLARALIGRRSYKSDAKLKQTNKREAARRELLEMIRGGALEESYGLKIKAKRTLADDPTGDQLDALLCAMQAAWSWLQRDSNYGAPAEVDALEGWICDPQCRALSLG